MLLSKLAGCPTLQKPLGVQRHDRHKGRHLTGVPKGNQRDACSGCQNKTKQNWWIEGSQSLPLRHWPRGLAIRLGVRLTAPKIKAIPVSCRMTNTKKTKNNYDTHNIAPNISTISHTRAPGPSHASAGEDVQLTPTTSKSLSSKTAILAVALPLPLLQLCRWLQNPGQSLGIGG